MRGKKQERETRMRERDSRTSRNKCSTIDSRLVLRLARVCSIVAVLGHEICIGISSTLPLPSSRFTTPETPTTSRNEPGG